MKRWLIRLTGLVCILLLVEILKINKENLIICVLSMIYLYMAKEGW